MAADTKYVLWYDMIKFSMPQPKHEHWVHFVRMLDSGPRLQCWPWPFTKDQKGYPLLGRARLGRIACEAVHGLPSFAGAQVCHAPKATCPVGPSCFNPAHLRWGTADDQAADRLIDDTYRRGEQHHSAKLTEEDVRAIRSRYATNTTNCSALGREYGVTYQQVNRIVRREAWGHLD